MRIAFQMDPPASLNVTSDSTIALMEEALARGASCYYYLPQHLSIIDAQVRARAHPITLQLGSSPYFTLGEACSLTLSEMGAVLIRQDPPFDMHYLTATYMLENLPPHVRVMNPPAALRNFPEKLSVLEFPEFLPPTLISEEEGEITAFAAHHRDVVAKPLYGYGGHGVYVFRAGDPNLATFLEQWRYARGGALVWQAFLPQVAQSECRILFIAGKVEASFIRRPQAGSIRSNMRVGGTPEIHTLSAAQAACCARVGAWLASHNIMLAGVDMIGDHLIEINLTSPTGLRAAEALYGKDLATIFWDRVFAAS